MQKYWRKKSTEAGGNIRLFDIEHVKYEFVPDSSEHDMVILRGRDAANVVAINKNKEILLVRQFRFGIEDTTLELPGGLLELGEEALDGVQRELREETGYGSDHWHFLGKMAFNPAFQPNFLQMFIASDVSKRWPTEWDDSEYMETVLMDVEEVYEKIHRGGFIHPHTIAPLLLAKPFL